MDVAVGVTVEGVAVVAGVAAPPGTPWARVGSRDAGPVRGRGCAPGCVTAFAIDTARRPAARCVSCLEYPGSATQAKRAKGGDALPPLSRVVAA